MVTIVLLAIINWSCLNTVSIVCGVEDTMRITLVIAVCVAVVLLGQARTSSSQV